MVETKSKNVESEVIYFTKFFEELEEQYSRAQKRYRRRLSKFFEPLVSKYRVAKEIKRQTDRYLASDFNLIELIDPDENKVSDIIKKLLKPGGEHGQGDVFLREFLEVVKEHLEEQTNGDSKVLKYLERVELSEAEIEREATTHNKRRIDILIKFPSDFVIGIENKIWCKDSCNQLEDYNKFLEECWRDNYILIFLDSYGYKAESISEDRKDVLKSEGNYLEVSYNNFLKPWLIRCYKECESDKVRWFLKDFASWIEKNFREEVEDDGEERVDRKLSA